MIPILKKLFMPVTATIDYIQNHFKAMLFFLLLILLFWPSQQESLHPNNLQSIELSGAIRDTTQVVKALDDAGEDENIEGVLFVVDSPGGAVPPSLEVTYAIKRLAAKKPVVVYAKGTLASGSYYAAIWADEIVANPGSIVGSIGVIMEGANLHDLMKKIGISTQVAKAGKYKQVGTVDREWTPYERAEIDKVIRGTYDMFVRDVAEARGLDLNKSRAYADAHIFTAAQAKAVGLVDTVGVEYDAKRLLETKTGVTEPVWNEPSGMEKLFRKFGSEAATLLHTYFPETVLK